MSRSGPNPSRFRLGVGTLLLCLASQGASAEIVVIVNPNSPIESLSVEQVASLYLGRIRGLQPGMPALVVDQKGPGGLRERFFQQLVGMSLPRVNAYWARLQFSGDTQPPISVPDDRRVVELVARDHNAIGYVDANAVDDSVRIVLRLEE